MTIWPSLLLLRDRWTPVRVPVRVHRPRPAVVRVAPAKCPRCPLRSRWRPSFLPRCRWCGDTGVWTEWRTEVPGHAVQHAVQ